MRDRLDYLFLLPTFDRYDYLVQVIDRIIEQTKTFSVKIGIVNDHSKDQRYDGLLEKYGDILVYEKNEVNYGKEKYYLTVNKLLDIAKNNKSEKYIFLADDSLPSKNFLIHVEKFFQKGAKVVNTAIHQQELRTNWGLNNWVDGGLVITHDIFLKVNQKLEKVVKAGYGTGVFREITLRLNRLNIRVHFPKHSLLYHMGHTDSVMHKEIRKTEQIHSYSFIDDEESPDVFRLETYDLLNQKVQISVSNAVRNFKTKMISKYELKEYINKNQPTVFFGMYDENDYKKFINHVGQKIIVWCGTDALNAKKNKHWWNELKKGVNISMSSFIYKSLEFCGIESTIIPITPTKSTVNVKPKGENIYWYHNSESKKEFYGGKIVEKIKKLTNYKIIEAKVDTFNEEEIQNVYESCFLGLRLTEHDGLPNTVVEMGLMGRYCLHNGNTPNSIQYDPNNVEDIVKKINEEYQSRFKVDSEIAQKVYNYMTSGNDIKKIFFSYDTIVDNKKFEIINKNEILRKKQFPKIGSKQKNKKELSIVIPTYNNVEYLDTCVHSILESSKNFDVEVLIGIDGCQKTLNYIKQKSYPDQIQIYYFDTNNGPYDIKNTLTKKTDSENILFFDSDDVAEKSLVRNIIENLKSYDCIKPKYKNFGYGVNPTDKPLFGEGVFGIKKELFISMNGFEPWFCAADTDFMVRLYKMKSKVLHTNDVLFRRRIHSQGLTSKPETGFRSPKRHQYQKMSKAKVGIGNPSILHIRDCVLIDDLVEYSSNTEIFSNHDNIRALNAVFNKTPKKVVQNEVKSKQQVVANNPLLNLLNSKSKQIDKEKITEQRQNIINIRQKTNKDVYKELHPSKPNRRLDLPRLKL